MKTKTKKETQKPLEITREAFESWLSKQPFERRFCYMDNQRCLIASFLRESGLAPRAEVGGAFYRLTTTHKTFGPENSIPFDAFLTEINGLTVSLYQFTAGDFIRKYLAS